MIEQVPSLIMGVLNVTPDSFSDGGSYLDPQKAVEKAWQLTEQGADIIDIGAESTKPGSKALSAEAEWQRLRPVLEALAREKPSADISLDTYKPEIMLRALDYPVSIINDVRGAAETTVLARLATQGLTYVAMHMHREPSSMQRSPLDAQEALLAVASFYESSQARLLAAGFSPDRIWLDPGIGFGKTDAANVCLLRQAFSVAPRLRLVLGISRKSFIGRILGIEEPKDRDAPSKMLELSFLLTGIHCIRTHDVARLCALRDLLTQS